MNTRVKICGLTRPEDVECAIENGVAFLGFIVECPSKRRLTVAEAAKLGLPAKGLAARVAVTVNPDDDLIDRIVSQMQPDYIQLHGDETPARAAEIAKQCKVIKAIGIASDADMKTKMSRAPLQPHAHPLPMSAPALKRSRALKTIEKLGPLCARRSLVANL